MKKFFKSLIIKFLLKYLDGSPKKYYYVRDNLKFYLFLRWLAELVSDKKRKEKVYCDIASYLLNNNFDFPFTDIFLVENVICIYTTRPGLWIGKGGVNVDTLTYSLNFNLNEEMVNNYKIRFIENTKGSKAEIIGYFKVLCSY